MPRLTIGFGVVLLVLGGAAYAWALGSGNASVTALIPAFFGLPVLVLGLAGRRWPARSAVLTGVAAALALLGLIGSGRGLLSLGDLISRPEEVARPAAVIVQSVMAVLCVVYLLVAVGGLLKGRRGQT